MPYIPSDQRPRIDTQVDELEKVINSDGQANYAITTLLDKYAAKVGRGYTTYNAIIGILECVKQEYYRKRIAPYEDSKEQLNGSVLE